MYAVRRWSVSNARGLNRVYRAFEVCLLAVSPLLRRIGFARLERPVAGVERAIKGTLFDCRMCGQCVLSDTGLSCPMNCPKNLRNGPCGGVRPNGHCEVKPDMPCVWVEAWRGAQAMGTADPMTVVLPAIDYSLEGRSSWLAVARRQAEKDGIDG